MSLVDELRDAVGGEHVLTDPDVVAGYVTDWTGRYAGHTPAVVRPATTGEVAAVLAVCRGVRHPLVPQGGNTGLVAGGVPLAGEVVLSLRRLATVGPVDLAAGQVTAASGASLAEVQRAASAAGWAYGIDLSARDSATVGGMVATNAGGVHVIRHGHTRAQLTGIEAVLADGSVVRHLAGLDKDNTGYDLAGLLCGSEGTLGVITAARLRLVAAPVAPVAALAAFDDVATAVAAAATARRSVASLQALELLLDDGVELVAGELGVRRPFAARHAAYLLVEAETGGSIAAFAGAIDGLAGAVDVAVADDPERRRALWLVRDRHAEAIALLGPVLKLDVAVPLSVLGDFVDALPGVVEGAAPGARTWRFGHAGDGNVHVNVTGFGDRAEAATEAVLSLTAQHGGSISAEHGIGTLKRRWLHLSRTPEEIAAFRSLKRALDPDGILNPNALLPPE
jgi:FAD/FMN-containing dehydrogenase